jgi:hypothetical protein
MKLTSMLLVVLAACSRSNQAANAADSALPPIDTLKAAVVDSSLRADSTPRAPASPTVGTKTAAQSQTGTKTAPPDTTNLGRDRAIKINTKDPKVMIPTVDTTKRRPPA